MPMRPPDAYEKKIKEIPEKCLAEAGKDVEDKRGGRRGKEEQRAVGLVVGRRETKTAVLG